MKHTITIIFCFIACATFSQANNSKGRFGVAVNSSYLGEIESIGIAPTATFIKEKQQIELGFGFHPFTRSYHRMLSTELNYKYFPNGIENNFNLYFIGVFSFINYRISYTFDAIHNSLILAGGFGFEYKLLKHAYIGANVNLGYRTESRSAEISNDSFTIDFFDGSYLSGAARVHIGYRFYNGDR